MFQPFEKFKPEYIRRLIELNKKYLVSQLYTRASHSSPGKIDLLFSDYTDRGQAEIHYKAVIKDQFAAIIDLTNPAHKQKVEEMVMEGSKYTIYWNTVRRAAEIKKIINQTYKPNLRRYLLNSTLWRIGSNHAVKPSFEVTFGELFIIVRWGGQTLRIKFAEIENA